jgi:hypothetical protein
LTKLALVVRFADIAGNRYTKKFELELTIFASSKLEGDTFFKDGSFRATLTPNAAVGQFAVRGRKTIKRMQEVKSELRNRMHDLVAKTKTWVSQMKLATRAALNCIKPRRIFRKRSS